MQKCTRACTHIHTCAQPYDQARVEQDAALDSSLGSIFGAARSLRVGINACTRIAWWWDTTACCARLFLAACMMKVGGVRQLRLLLLLLLLLPMLQQLCTVADKNTAMDMEFPLS